MSLPIAHSNPVRWYSVKVYIFASRNIWSEQRNYEGRWKTEEKMWISSNIVSQGHQAKNQKSFPTSLSFKLSPSLPSAHHISRHFLSPLASFCLQWLYNMNFSLPSCFIRSYRHYHHYLRLEWVRYVNLCQSLRTEAREEASLRSWFVVHPVSGPQVVEYEYHTQPKPKPTLKSISFLSSVSSSSHLL